MEKSTQKLLKAMLYGFFFVMLLLAIYLRWPPPNNEQQFSLVMRVVIAVLLLIRTIKCILNYRKEIKDEMLEAGINF